MVENRPCLFICFVCLLSPWACLLSSVFVCLFFVSFVDLFVCLLVLFIYYHLKLASSPVSDTRRLTAVVDQRDLDKKILSRLKHLTFKFTLRCSAVCSISSIMVKHLSKDSFLWLLFISETWARKFSPGSNILHLNSPFPSYPPTFKYSTTVLQLSIYVFFVFVVYQHQKLGNHRSLKPKSNK